MGLTVVDDLGALLGHTLKITAGLVEETLRTLAQAKGPRRKRGLDLTRGTSALSDARTVREAVRSGAALPTAKAVASSKAHENLLSCEDTTAFRIAIKTDGALDTIRTCGLRLRNFTTLVTFNVVARPKECRMANNKNPKEKQPGENPEGKYHFNPGNMAGKKARDAEQTDENRGAPHDRKEKEKPAS